MLTSFQIRNCEDEITATGEAWVDYYPADPDVGQMFALFDLSQITINNKELKKKPNKILEEIIIDAFEKELYAVRQDRLEWEYENRERF